MSYRRLEELDGLRQIAGPDQMDELLLETMTLAKELRSLGGSLHWKQFQGKGSGRSQ